MRSDSVPKRKKKVAKLKDRVSEFYRNLNVYKRARLIMAIRSGLQSLDRPEEEVSAFLDGVMLRHK